MKNRNEKHKNKTKPKERKKRQKKSKIKASHRPKPMSKKLNEKILTFKTIYETIVNLNLLNYLSFVMVNVFVI